MSFTVFYAWQSDTDRDLNQRFIRSALEDAIHLLHAEFLVDDAPAIEVQIDQDTKDVPGIPHIAETIKKKIRDCTVFLGDVTYVCQYVNSTGKQKRSPNANVLIELGLALQSKGSDRIILVQNASFGPPDDLPFDLRHHRFPIRYRLETSKDKAVDAEHARLVQSLVMALKPILQIEVDLKTKQETQLQADNRHIQWKYVAARRTKFEKAIAEGQYNIFNFTPLALEPHLRQIPAFLAVTIAPTMHPQQLDIAELFSAAGKQMRPVFVDDWKSDIFPSSIVNHKTVTRPLGIRDHELHRTDSLVELSDDGCVFLANKLLDEHPLSELGKANTVDFYQVERTLLMHMRDYIKVLINECKLAPPFLTGISILNPRGIKLFLRNQVLRPLLEDIVTSFVNVAGDFDIHDDAATIRTIAKAVRPSLDTIWRASGIPEDPFFDENDIFHSKG